MAAAAPIHLQLRLLLAPMISTAVALWSSIGGSPSSSSAAAYHDKPASARANSFYRHIASLFSDTTPQTPDDDPKSFHHRRRSSFDASHTPSSIAMRLVRKLLSRSGILCGILYLLLTILFLVRRGSLSLSPDTDPSTLSAPSARAPSPPALHDPSSHNLPVIGPAENPDTSSPSSTPDLDKVTPIPDRVWTYWEPSAPNQDPPLWLRENLECWRRQNENHTVTLLTPANFRWFVGLRRFPNFESVSRAHRREWIKLAVLVENGGVWMDPTTLLTRPLADFVHEVQQRRKVESLAFYDLRFNTTITPSTPVSRPASAAPAPVAAFTSFLPPRALHLGTPRRRPHRNVARALIEPYFLAAVPQSRIMLEWFNEFNWVVTNFAGKDEHYVNYLTVIHRTLGFKELAEAMRPTHRHRVDVDLDRVPLEDPAAVAESPDDEEALAAQDDLPPLSSRIAAHKVVAFSRGRLAMPSVLNDPARPAWWTLERLVADPATMTRKAFREKQLARVKSIVGTVEELHAMGEPEAEVAPAMTPVPQTRGGVLGWLFGGRGDPAADGLIPHPRNAAPAVRVAEAHRRLHERLVLAPRYEEEERWTWSSLWSRQREKARKALEKDERVRKYVEEERERERRAKEKAAEEKAAAAQVPVPVEAGEEKEAAEEAAEKAKKEAEEVEKAVLEEEAKAAKGGVVRRGSGVRRKR
ncbi:hypothetical protein HDU96_001457 [Phlyctochytrium bullatum]|nr:hypothetical protein HDU96_001457 [Phlyctochytrium bullatum]